MGIRKQTWFIAVCDICSHEFENGDGGTQGFTNKKSAKDLVVGECNWMIKDGKLICPWCVEDARA